MDVEAVQVFPSLFLFHQLYNLPTSDVVPGFRHLGFLKTDFVSKVGSKKRNSVPSACSMFIYSKVPNSFSSRTIFSLVYLLIYLLIDTFFLPLTSDSVSSDALSGLWFSDLHVSMSLLPGYLSLFPRFINFYVWFLSEHVPTCKPLDILPVFLLFGIDCSELSGWVLNMNHFSWGFLPTKALCNGIAWKWVLKLKPVLALLKSGL